MKKRAGGGWMHFFGKNFVKTTYIFTNEITRVDLTKKKFSERKFLVFPQCNVTEIYFHTVLAEIS